MEYPCEQCGRSFKKKTALGGHISHAHGKASAQAKKALLEKARVNTAGSAAKEPVIEYKVTNSITKVASPITPTVTTPSKATKPTQVAKFSAPIVGKILSAQVETQLDINRNIMAEKREALDLLTTLDTKRGIRYTTASVQNRIYQVEWLFSLPSFEREAHLKALAIELEKPDSKVLMEMAVDLIKQEYKKYKAQMQAETQPEEPAEELNRQQRLGPGVLI